MARRAARSDRPDGRVAVVLSGGIALGAYQAGAYAVLHEHGLRPGWLAGSSVGAVNAAIVAGNPPEAQVAQLRRFWEDAASDLAPSGPYAAPPPPEGPWRHAHNWISVVQSRLFGRPGLFRPRLLVPGGMPTGGPGLYDLTPLQARLEELVDFERLNGGGIRLSVATTDVATGEEVVFDTRHGARLEPVHFLASCGMPPDFPPVEIDGRLLGDGGLAANAPVDAVLGEPWQAEDGDLLCFVLDLFAREGGRPRSLEAAVMRRRDLIFANQSRNSLEAQRRQHRLRAMIGRLATRLPPEVRDDPDVAPILAEGSERAVTVFHLSYRAPKDEAADKPFDFSRTTLTDRWRAGELDMAEALRRLPDLRGAEARVPGLTMHEIRR